eukprot:149321-Prorocentrum_minimum.AAC.2
MFFFLLYLLPGAGAVGLTPVRLMSTPAVMAATCVSRCRSAPSLDAPSLDELRWILEGVSPSPSSSPPKLTRLRMDDCRLRMDDLRLFGPGLSVEQTRSDDWREVSKSVPALRRVQLSYLSSFR